MRGVRTSPPSNENTYGLKGGVWTPASGEGTPGPQGPQGIQGIQGPPGSDADVTTHEATYAHLTTLGTAAGKNIPATGNASATEVVYGTDTRLTDARALAAGADKTKLDGIAAGAEVNVNADWDASSGDAQIANKPTLGAMAAVADAPSDGSTYGRLNGAWAVAGGGSGLTHPQVMARVSMGV